MLTVHLQGGLGNQLFQVAAAETIAEQTGRTLRLPPCPSTHHSSQDYFQTILASFAPLRHEGLSAQCVREPSYAYRTWSFTEPVVELDGYFQNYKYVSPTFRDRLVCPPDIPERPGAFLHIRGGDYVTHFLHDVSLAGYYERALKAFPPDTHFYVFTNDRAYAESLPWLASVAKTWVDEPDEVRALWSLSRCRVGGICANSTFSWWGAFLAPHRTLVLPSRWFTDPSVYVDGYFFPGSLTVQV